MKKKFRGLMTGLLGISMILGSLGSVSAAPVPKDIVGHWAQGQLQQWLNNGYLGGYPDGTVKPNKAITRGEYVTLVNRLFGFTETTTINFSDMKSTNWTYSEVAKAVKAGYIGGYENNTFRPNNPLTRQEAAVITAKVLRLNTNTTSNKFKDNAQISAWAKGAVAAAADKKIINGYPDGTFGPKRSLTRAEAVGIISNSVIHNPGTGGGNIITPIPTPTPNVTPTPTPTTSPTPTVNPGGGTSGPGGGDSGNVTAPTVSGATYGNVGSVTADVYLTPSVTGTVYYVVVPYKENASVPSAVEVEKGLTSAGTTAENKGSKATVANTKVTLSVYGLDPETKYSTYIVVADTSGKLSTVTTVSLTTAKATATSIRLFERGNVGTVTADVYLKYGANDNSTAPVRYVVLPESAATPTAAQIAAGQDSKGADLKEGSETGILTLTPNVRHTHTLTGLKSNTAYKVYLVTGSGNTRSPIEIIQIHTK